MRAVWANKARRRQVPLANCWKALDSPSLLRQWLLFYVLGVYLLTVVFLSPHAGYGEGRSFFEVAGASPWNRWWDWAAVWCSLKIILLSLGLASLLAALWMLLRGGHRRRLAVGLLLLSAAPGALFGFGVYYLLKALL